MAEKLNFKKNPGIKEYCFQNDETAIIRVNTSDPNLYSRLQKGKKRLEKLAEKYRDFSSDNSDEVVEMIDDIDKKIKSEINYMFDSDVSAVAFGNANCLELDDDGEPTFKNFLNALLPVVEEEIKAKQNKANKNISKYVNQAKQYK